MINIAFSLIISFYFIFRHSRIFVSKTFVLPVIIFTILYNVPKFFELYVKEEVMTKTLNCSEVLSEDLYHGNMGCQVFKRGIQWLETVQDFLIKLGIKPLMHLLEISILALNNGGFTKIMNNLVKDIKILSFKVIFQCLKLVEYLIRRPIILMKSFEHFDF